MALVRPTDTDEALVARTALANYYGSTNAPTGGGINGDMVGATIEGGELWLLVLMWSWWQFATV
mgnify:CR=1 FL=1